MTKTTCDLCGKPADYELPRAGNEAKHPGSLALRGLSIMAEPTLDLCHECVVRLRRRWEEVMRFLRELA